MLIIIIEGFIFILVFCLIFILQYFFAGSNLLIFNLLIFPVFSIFVLMLMPIRYSRLVAFNFNFFNFVNFFLLCVFKFNFSVYSIQFYKEFTVFYLFNVVYSAGLDWLNMVFIFLTFILTLICFLSVWFNTQNIKQNLVLISLVQFLLFQVFSVLDIFFFFVFYEFVLFPMFLLISAWGGRPQKIYAAYLFFYYTLVGSVFMLFSILYIHVTVGSTSYVALLSHTFTEFEQTFLFFGFFVSFASKLPIYPFHVWLPEAHVEAPTAASVLLAGVLLKMGGYGLIRWSLMFFFEASVLFSPVVNTLCLISILYASFSALCQLDIKRIIAYSSIVHMSYSTLGIFSFNDLALTGSVFSMVTHGIISAGLFLSVGILYDRYGTRSLLSYGGLVRFMPMFDSIFFSFILANMAFPGTGGFISEFLTLLGIYKVFPVSIIVLLLGVFFTGVFSIWLYTRVFFGNCNYQDYLIYGIISNRSSNGIAHFSDITYREFFIFFPLIILNFLFGLFPAFITYPLSCWSIFFFSSIL